LFLATGALTNQLCCIALYHSWRKIDSTAIHDPKETRGVIWGAGGPSPPRKKKKKKEEKKKRERKEKKRKKKEGNYELLHIKCCFFQFFNNPVTLKNKKIFGPPRKS
jgi:hypothetical protein